MILIYLFLSLPNKKPKIPNKEPKILPPIIEALDIKSTPLVPQPIITNKKPSKKPIKADCLLFIIYQDLIINYCWF
jgi:hypothetical protein